MSRYWHAISYHAHHNRQMEYQYPFWWLYTNYLFITLFSLYFSHVSLVGFYEEEKTEQRDNVAALHTTCVLPYYVLMKSSCKIDRSMEVNLYYYYVHVRIHLRQARERLLCDSISSMNFFIYEFDAVGIHNICICTRKCRRCTHTKRNITHHQIEKEENLNFSSIFL